MVSRSGDLEVERSGLEVQKHITVEVEVTRLFVPIPQPDKYPDLNFPRARANAPAGQTECERRISMRRHGPRLVVLSIFVGTALFASCSKPYHENNERYVFVATNINLPYWQDAQAGFLDAAKALGVKAELVGPTGYAPNAELGIFRQIVEEHPAGICLSAARPEIFQAAIDQAIAQGISVICVDADAPNSKRVLYIGTDNFKAGKESLKQMAALVPDNGSVVVITIPGQRAALEITFSVGRYA
jgi:ABC-type sugar transport system substrate-binding protein